ncbi:Protein pob1, partial [Geodia barretti]
LVPSKSRISIDAQYNLYLALSLLLYITSPGAYIVRSSISLENTFVFSFRNQTGIKHWQLSDREGKYYWGSSSGFHTLESFVEHFAEALSQVTHLHVYPGMTTALTPQFHTTEQQSMIGRLRAMDDRLGYGQLCRVIKDVNSEIRQGRKESIGRKPVPRKRGDSTANSSVQTEWDSTMVIAVNRLQAEEILNKEGRPGSFLVRPSEKTPGDYALAFRTTSEVRHWKMVQDGGKFYVHPRPNPYNNLEEIIQHFREAVGQETGLVMTPLVLDWSRTIVKTPNIVVHGESVSSEDFPGVTPDTLLPLPASPSRLSRGGSEKSSTLGRTSKPSPSMSPLNPANLTSWSVDDVTQWLIQKDLGKFMDIFRDNLVDGECLMALDNTLLKEDLGINALGHRSRIMKRVNELKASFEPQQTS